MNKKLFSVVAIALAVLFTASAAMAAPQIYVRNKPIGNGVPSQGRIYVDLQRFLQASGFSYKMNDKTLEIAKTGGTGGRINAIPTRYSYNGRYFTAHTINIAGKPYVMADPVASAFGMAKRYTRSVDVYDYFYTNQIPPVRDAKKDDTKTDTKTDTGKPDDGKATDGKDQKREMVSFKGTAKKLGDKCLIEPHNNFFYDFNTKELRGSVYFQNKFDKDPLTKINVVFKIVIKDDMAGIWSKRYAIGEMESGAKTKKFDYYFVNPSGVEIYERNFYYEIEYLEPKKPEKKK